MPTQPQYKAPPLLTFLATYFVWMLTIGAAIVGVILLYIASEKFTGQPGLELWHDLFRDIGIAFIVAAIVAGIYELHARTRFDRETITGVLAAMLNDIVDEGVWQEVKSQIIEKPVVRKDVNIKVKLKKESPLPKGQQLIWLEFEYKLCGLRTKPRRVQIRHFLDSFMTNERLNLPRFEQVVVGDAVYRGAKLSKYLKGGIFTQRVYLEGRYGEPMPVMIERSEIAYVPGSYNLVMAELTAGVRLHLEELPDEISVEVNMKSEVSPLEEGRVLECDKVFLPGQAIEFRFKPKLVEPEVQVMQPVTRQIEPPKGQYQS